MLERVLTSFLLVAWLPHGAAAASTSVFTARPDDPAAVYVDAPGPQATGDETARLQAALDRAGASPGGGLVFVPAGRYPVTRTLLVWRGVRVIGYGATRPVFVLPERTPGFQSGLGVLIHFTHGRPPGAPGGGPGGGGRIPFPPPGLVPKNDAIADANQSTFYSSMMNVDVEIGDGNPAAAAIRFHVAQHGVLSHIDFQLGSGLAGLVDVGNVGQDLRFHGGRYGILATNTSPYWPYTLIDSEFEGQREAAIREHTSGLTVVRTTFRDVPVGISIDPGYSDQLWLKDARFERVATAAIVFDKARNASTAIGVEDAICTGVPVFATARDGGPATAGPAATYRVRRFHHGLFVRGGESTGRIDHVFEAAAVAAVPAPLPPALPALPPVDQWTNVRTLGVKGDGVTDDTQALQAAVDAHRVLYFPTGYYQVRDTIRLKADSVLIALHPNTTQLDLPDRLDAFAGVGSPKGLIEAPSGGATIVSGLGLFTGAINPRATAVLWLAGKDSFLDDIQIHGAGLTFFPPNVSAALGGPARPNAPPGPPGPPGPRGRLGAQYPSIYVTRGGGGIFHNIWSANTYARSGFHVSDTATPGVVYELSAEHHLFSEIRLDRVQHWTFHGPQTEEEVSTSADAVAFEITDATDVTIANYRAYRVARSYAPFPAAMRVEGASQVRLRNVAVNAEHGYAACDAEGCGTILRAGKFAYDNAVEDAARRRVVRERLFAVLDLDGRGPEASAAAGLPAGAAAAFRGATVEKLADGFHSIAGAAVDTAGTLYFVDHREQRIFSWSPSSRLKVVRDAPLDPVNLGVDRSGSLLVLSSAGSAGTVYAVRPDDPRDALTVLPPQPRPAATATTTFLLPSTIWTDGQFRSHLDLTTYEYETHAQMFAHEATTPSPKAYVSPDGSLILPAGRVFSQGPDGSYPGMDETGWRWSHALDAFGLIAARPGERVYVTSGAENRTYRGVVRDDGTLGDLTVFAERGGEGAVADREGNVYVANGQIFVYGPTGTPLGRIDVPARPTGLRFGGPGGRTLYVLTHHALYAVTLRGSTPAAAAPRATP